ncbi:enoyl-CoA hydratase/isomerase family protein [Sphingomonas sp. BN140010]|uniref:3-hydroxyisobutyryl-CoA hydrolase n=1 Tax=Sphingomonas arvum TaxID=2992113 RepID=A0ABT3JHV4_9SPHN|nr:enoyl-CoA hydratase/isomerase family protein [Sphingomonas sp. BN140010]MCW3798529.1 enoyl-CoA hydratase/isomerase family protein [Sphingomonas sp. BN140010]
MTTDVLTFTEGPLGRIRLNRPKALHALTREMCEAMSAALLAWREDLAVKAVLIDHAEGRGFCAGGDVVMLARSGADDGQEAAAFFHAEYRLNHLLFTYPKPTIALMDGITMGGGVGISLPCKFRVATENTRLAMPETGIGLFPDVGGGWYLSRLPGRIGQFMALTGARLDGAECHYLRLATHYVEQASLPDLVERLAKTPGRASGAIGAYTAVAPTAKIEANVPAISKLFASDSLEDVMAALEAEATPWAETELATIKSKSPLSCKVSLRLLAEGAQRTDFADEMAAEYALACRVVRTHDFVEGVRALLIDKDQEPKWNPAVPEAVLDETVDQLFVPLPPGEEWTPFPQA